MFAEVNGIRLYYEVTGSGRPLVMVHGNGEDHTIFAEAAELLQEHFTCYLVDSRGHGASTPADILHYEEMADDMTAFLEALDLRDVVFYGFSDGGIVGLLAASRCPRITTLITSGANLTPQGVIRPLRALFRVMYFLKKDPKTALMMTEPQIGDDVLKKITARTLVLAGSHDLVTEKETKHIAQTIPGARLVILPGEGHGSYIVHRTKIAKIIRSFVLSGPKRREKHPSV